MIDTGGETVRLVVRRLRCMNENCRRIHHELPDVVVPYKMHTAATFEKIIANDFQDTPAEAVGKSLRTVNRALLADPTGNHGGAKKRGRSKLDPYRKEILNLSMKGQSSLKINKQIKAKGYDGSASLIRNFILKESVKNTGSMQQINYQRIERQSIISLF